MPLNGVRRTRMGKAYNAYAKGVMKYSGANAVAKAAQKAGAKYKAYAQKSIAEDRAKRAAKRAADIKKYSGGSYYSR